jgi:hybrid cluster-associated redox disulfide protein
LIEKEMSIEDAVRRFPKSATVFERHRMGCIGCRAALFETIEQGAKVHGVDVEALMADLRKAIQGG